MNFNVCTLLFCVLGVCAVNARPQNWWDVPQQQQQQQQGLGSLTSLFIDTQNLPQQQPQQQQQPQPQLTNQQQQGGDLLLRTTMATPTTASPQYLSCLRSCPSTSEYNPLCGSDGEDYKNNGHLQCANFCGRAVTALRMGTCEPV